MPYYDVTVGRCCIKCSGCEAPTYRCVDEHEFYTEKNVWQLATRRSYLRKFVLIATVIPIRPTIL